MVILILVHRVATETETIDTSKECNGLQMNDKHESAQSEEVETIETNTSLETVNQSETTEATTNESALESLAKNLEAIGKYRELQTDAKVNDMIAFKVMTVDFQISDYIIGLIEELHGDTSSTSYDLTILIMGKSDKLDQLILVF